MASSDRAPAPISQPARPVGVQDVARAAGVSTATVSRALTAPDLVRSQTRTRVLEAARRLGYAPNEAARSLRAGTSRMVLVLTAHQSSQSFMAGVLAGIDSELSAHGYTMIVGSLEANERKARRLYDLVFARHLDGVIVLTSLVPTLDGRSMLAAGVPVVSICTEVDGTVLQSVLIDDEGWAAAQTRHLLELGHRRLMYVAGPDGSYNDVRRFAGFMRAAEAARIDPVDVLRQPGDWSLASGVTAGERFLSLRRRPTGVVCASDEMAIGFIKSVKAAGLDCPDDVSVVGFDGIDYAEFCEPTLTTVRQPREALGRTGARALIDALHGDGEAVEPRVVLGAELLVRASTGRPAG